jgi:hypothetical protein
VLAPVHQLHDDRARVRGDLDEIEALLFRDAAGFFDGEDAVLGTVGADQSDGTQTDLVIDPDLIVDATPPSRRAPAGTSGRQARGV